ncbi:hypothetical protein [Dyadobacter psychrotolerans]|uniref:Uncharacterized protein n=1 Tax=Dyadobacter psychrotolerans TaxID=2541721 RepID=A0A4V2Z497_9BACT|nr:hypothetical protein [Dyadobacter psychrotolerans]TDE15228.1 hypothetical protein E0F88_11935 [Dyadobacter psychrotolerans]
MLALFEKIKSEIFTRWPDYDLMPSDDPNDGNGAVLSFVVNSEHPKGVQMSYYMDWILEVYVLPELILDETNHKSLNGRFSSRGRHFTQNGGNAFSFVTNPETRRLIGRDVLDNSGTSDLTYTPEMVVEKILEALEK